jgi:predicted RNase H-like HicB family nuclease
MIRSLTRSSKNSETANEPMGDRTLLRLCIPLQSMSTDTPEPSDRPPALQNITLALSENGETWVAKDEDTGVSSQGPSREAALENLDEAVAGFHGGGTEPSDEQLRELGINPENNTSGSLDDSEIFE